MRLSGYWIVGCLLWAGCEGDRLGPRPSTGFFEPEEVDFGEVPVGRTHVGPTTFRNTSGSTLIVRSVRFEPALDVYGAFLTEGGTLNGATLTNGRAVEVEVRFGPRVAGTFDARMIVEADDLSIELPLKARARDEQPARPEVMPSALAFTGTPVGAAARRGFELRNTGDQTGRLDQVLLAPGPFTITRVDGAPLRLPILVEANQSLELEVRYQPLMPDQAHREVATFAFSGGSRPAVLNLSGRSTALETLACPEEPIEFGAVPRGRSETRTVRCLRPPGWQLRGARYQAGSAPYFTLPESPRVVSDGSLEMDLGFEALGPLGQHLGTLELESTEGSLTRLTVTGTISPPAATDVEVAVELTWNTPFSDFDLHLVRAGGMPFVAGEDCYFASKNPAWGDLGSSLDDPFLDRDDREGYGPETLTLLRAGEERYEVYVQYHDFTRNRAEATTATIVWTVPGASGRLESDFLECGGWWHVGTFVRGPPLRFEVVNLRSLDFRARAAERCR